MWTYTATRALGDEGVEFTCHKPWKNMEKYGEKQWFGDGLLGFSKHDL